MSAIEDKALHAVQNEIARDLARLVVYPEDSVWEIFDDAYRDDAPGFVQACRMIARSLVLAFQDYLGTEEGETDLAAMLELAALQPDKLKELMGGAE